MKKNEIILARIISTASAAALALLILAAGIGSNYFTNVLSKFNNNTISGAEAGFYNYYYYAGLNVVYQFLYAVTVMALIISIIAILFRLEQCQLVCVIAGVSSAVMAVFLIFSRIFENSVVVHRFIDSFFIGNTSGSEITTAQLLSKVPVWPIVLLIISFLMIILVRVTRFNKIKMYTSNEGSSAAVILLVGIYGAAGIYVLRDYLIMGMAWGGSRQLNTIYGYVKEYFIGERWLLSLTFAAYAGVAVILTAVLKNKVSSKMHKIISIGLPTCIAAIVGVYYMFNPAQIFGRLTLDEHVCDLTENAMTAYLIAMIAAIAFISVFIYCTYIKMSIKKVGIVIAVNIVLSVILTVIVGKFTGLVGMYAGCVVADVISIVYIFILKVKNKYVL